ncbi:MAG: ribbon-helix-helix protein, CopG family [Dehalococcoidia bacterium]|nr:ribbon-helix-helix protein, CopG family [Dehalococcoidia bacterium]
MRRIQIQLDEATYQILRSRAFREGTSMAALVRELLQLQLGMKSSREVSIKDFHFIASGRSEKSGLEPISERHDEALSEDFDR